MDEPCSVIDMAEWGDVVDRAETSGVSVKELERIASAAVVHALRKCGAPEKLTPEFRVALGEYLWAWAEVLSD